MADEFSDFVQEESTSEPNEFSSFVEGSSGEGLESEAPSWGWAAVKEAQDMWHGIRHLAETGFMQPFRLLPDQEPGTMTRSIQDLARTRGAEDVEALKGAPMQMIRSLGETFLGLVPGSDYSIYEKLRTAPIQTVSDLTLPFSFASGLAKGGAKAAGIAGKGATAAKLGAVADTISPTGIIKAGIAGAKELPGIGPSLRANYFGELPLEAQRNARRSFMQAEKFTQDQAVKLETTFADVPKHERDVVIDAIEGTLDTEVPLSAEAKTFLATHRAGVAKSNAREAAILSGGDPNVYQELTDLFTYGPFKPLAEKTSYQLGVKVTAPQAKALYDAGLIGSHELPPTYFPHRSTKLRPEHADQFVKSVEPYFHSSLKARKGDPDFDRDVLKAITNHERSNNRYLANYEAVMETVKSQGIPLTGYSRRDLDGLKQALDDINRNSGIEHVYLSPQLYKQVFNAQARAGQKISQSMASANTLEDGLRNALRSALDEFGDEYHQALQGASKDLYAVPKVSVTRLLREMGGTPDGMKAWGMAHDIWRSSVLALNPAWNTMNAVGNAMLATLSGSFNPKFRLKLRDHFLPDLQTSGMVAEAKLIDTMRAADKAKLRVAELPVGEWYNKLSTTLPGAALARVTQFGYRLNEIVDNFFRESVAAGKAKSVAVKQLREEGHGGLRLDPALIEKRAIEIVSDPRKGREVIDFTNKFMGNYFDLTPGERTYVRNFAFPFWSWYKSMLKLNASLPVEYPGRTKVLQMLDAARQEAEEDPLTPAALKNKIRLGESPEGNTIMASTKAMIPGIQATEGLPGFAPAASLLYGTATGKTMLGQRLGTSGVEEVRGQLFAVGEEGVSEIEQSLAMTGSNFLGALRETVRGLPQVRLTESLLKGETARPGDPLFEAGQRNPASPFSSKQTGWEALASMTGVQVKEYNEGLATYRHRRKLAQAYLQGRKKALLREREQDVIKDPEDEFQEFLQRVK